MYTVILNESGYEFELTEEMLAEMAKYGDVPSDWGLTPEECTWVSVEYARSDPHWSSDIPEGYPEELPLWEARI